MSKFGEPKACINSCGQLIYFDKNSTVGHPNPNVWVPLEVKEGRKTDVAHNCPKKKNGQTLQQTETTAAIIAKPDTLLFAEQLMDVIADYVRLKIKEQAAEAAAAKEATAK